MKTTLLSFTLLILAVSRAFACWMALPMEILVDEADLIVVGKVAGIQDGGFDVGGRKYDVTVVEITGVLKALPQLGQPKIAHVGQPAAGGGIAVSTDIGFRPGQQGVWLLGKDPGRNVFWARHPSQFQDGGKQKEISDMIAARKSLPGGEAVQGLVARAEIVESKPTKGPATFEARLSVRNVSDKPLSVCVFPGLQGLKIGRAHV